MHGLCWTATAVGLGVGALVGLTGIGSSTMLLPYLLLVRRLRPLDAVGTALVHSSVIKLLGTLQHGRLGTVDWRRVRWLAYGSIPAAALLAVLLGLLQQQSEAAANALVGRLLGLMLVLIALLLLGRVARVGSRSRLEGWLEGRWQRTWLALGGATVGALVSATSVGAGSILLALLALGTQLSAAQLAGTGVAHGALISVVGAVGHLWLGNVDAPLLFGLLLGSLPGTWLGSRASVRMPDRWLRCGLASLLLWAGWRMI